MTVEFIEKELSLALYRFGYGRLTVAQAAEKAKEVAPIVVDNCDKLGHKGLNWYAKQLIGAL